MAAACACTLLALGGCGESDAERAQNLRLQEAMRIVHVVSTAISYPRQDSADGYARAAQATTAGQDGRLRVIEAAARDNGGDRLEPIAHLVYAISVGSAGLPQVHDICLAQDYNVYGAAGASAQVDCPADDVSVTPPPAPPSVAIPVGADRVVERALRSGHGAPAAGAAVRSALARAAARTRPVTAPPTVTAATDGEDLGIAVQGEPGACLLGVRTNGEVSTWYLEREQAMPGELGCSPETALRHLGTTSPH